MLQPLLRDLVSLEDEGLYIPSLGRRVKGTVFSVVADNLGAHSIGGFVESFSGTHVCRFCLGDRSEFQVSEVRTGAFALELYSSTGYTYRRHRRMQVSLTAMG